MGFDLDQRRRFAGRTSLLASAIALLSGTAVAQDTVQNQGAAGSPDSGVLEQVLVTAQKRSELLTEVPISLVSMSSDLLESINVKNFTDLGFSVPGLRLAQFPFGALQTRLFIRGMGNIDVQVTQDPAVGMYQDGVYIARSTGLAFELGDVERIEVLRGPQGTLYGRNTTGGAINIINKKPGGELGMRAEASVGNFDYQRYLAQVNLPAVGGLATSITALYAAREGLVENTGVGDDFGGYERKGARLAANWKVTDDFSAYFTYEHTDAWNTFFYYQTQNVQPGFEGLFTPQEDRVTKASLAQPTEKSTLDLDALALTLDANIGDVTLRSITGYREFEASIYMDFSANPNFTAFRVNPQDCDHNQFSQELQVLGDLFGGNLDYIVGAYYFTEEAHQVDDYDAGAFFITHRVVDVSNDSYALFANLTYHVTPKLDLTVGGRYSDDSRDAEKFSADYTVPDPDTGVPPDSFDAFRSKSWSRFNPSAVVSYQVNDDINTYAKVVTGYRAGGFGTGSPTKEDFERGFDPEEVVSYEVGLKLFGWDDRLQFNAAAFYTEYDDALIDIAILEAPQYVASFNAGQATINGIELDLTVLPYDSLRIDASYAYLDAKFDEVVDPQTGTDITSNYALPNAPENAFSIAAQQHLGDITAGRFDLTLSYAWQDDVVTTAPVVTNPGARIDAYGLLNARLSFRSTRANNNFEVSLWGRNLTDEDYLIDSVGSFPFTTNLATHGDPVTYGIDFEWRY
jgi:iron complex outermembrane receptor protein